MMSIYMKNICHLIKFDILEGSSTFFSPVYWQRCKWHRLLQNKENLKKYLELLANT